MQFILDNLVYLVQRFYFELFKKPEYKSLASRKWQLLAHKHFAKQAKVQNFCHASTAGGKSVLILHDVAHHLLTNKDAKAYISSSSRQIISQFRNEKIMMVPSTWIASMAIAGVMLFFAGAIVSASYSIIYGTIFGILGAGAFYYSFKQRLFVDWHIHAHNFCMDGHPGTVQRFVQFIKTPVQSTHLMDRVLICCHATTARASHHLDDCDLLNVMAVHDECDLIKVAPGNPNNSADQPNQMGNFDNRLYDLATQQGNPYSIKLYKTTATPLRSDGASCIPGAIVENWKLVVDPRTTAEYRYERDQHMKTCALSMQMVLDGIAGGSRKLPLSLSKHFDKGNMTKTLVFIPSISCKRISRLGYDSAKYDYRDYVLQSLTGIKRWKNSKGLPVDWRKYIVNNFSTHMEIRRKDGQTFTVIDLVDVPNDQVDQDRRRLIKSYRDGTIPTPENLVIVALYKFTRGWDLPELNRIINLGQDISMTMIEQKFGRILRPASNKSKVVFVQYNRCGIKAGDRTRFRQDALKLATAYMVLGCDVATLMEIMPQVGGSGTKAKILVDCITELITSGIREDEINVQIRNELAKALGGDYIVRTVEVTPGMVKALRRSYMEMNQFANASLIHNFNDNANESNGPLVEAYKKLTRSDPKNPKRISHPSEQVLGFTNQSYFASIRVFWSDGLRNRFIAQNGLAAMEALRAGVNFEKQLAQQVLQEIMNNPDLLRFLKKTGSNPVKFLRANGLQKVIQLLDLAKTEK